MQSPTHRSLVRSILPSRFFRRMRLEAGGYLQSCLLSVQSVPSWWPPPSPLEGAPGEERLAKEPGTVGWLDLKSNRLTSWVPRYQPHLLPAKEIPTSGAGKGLAGCCVGPVHPQVFCNWLEPVPLPKANPCPVLVPVFLGRAEVGLGGLFVPALAQVLTTEQLWQISTHVPQSAPQGLAPWTLRRPSCSSALAG